MSALVVYALESGVLLGTFYALYVLILSRETFFTLNRIVLLLIPAISLLLPLLDFPRPYEPQGSNEGLAPIASFSKSYHDAMAEWESGTGSIAGTQADPGDDLGYWLSAGLLILYFIGLIVCLSRTVWSLRWIVRTLADAAPVENQGLKIIVLPRSTAPFSFLRYAFVPESLTRAPEFAQVLEHERAHAEEKHTFDLLYVQLVVAAQWFNPVAWLLLKSLKTLHEYIADRRVIQKGYSVSEYQSVLLRQLISNNSSELVHNFNLSFIKMRITMMTRKDSGWVGRAKAATAILMMLLTAGLVLQCNSRFEGPDPRESTGSQVSPDLPDLPANGFRFEGDLSDALTLSISGNTLRIGETVSAVSAIAAIEGPHGRETPLIVSVDKNQPMQFVRSVQNALRIADRRKLLYLAETPEGGRVETMLILPPDPASSGILQPDISEVPPESLLKIYLDKEEGPMLKQRVYDFVTSFLENGRAELAVVSAKMEDEMSYGDYLAGVYYVKEGYMQLYQERSRRMFGKDFYHTTKEEYDAVREGVPMNISIAED